MYECLYKRIIGFTARWGPLCVEDQPHMTLELSFTFETRFGMGDSWPVLVLVC
jgi:hypothetical protein